MRNKYGATTVNIGLENCGNYGINIPVRDNAGDNINFGTVTPILERIHSRRKL